MSDRAAQTLTPTCNIAAAFDAMALARGDAPAIIDGGRTISFTELKALTDRYAHALASVGIKDGMRTVLMVKPGIALIALAFAMFKNGAVPVLVDPGMGRQALGTCLAEARPEAFVGIPLAHAARLVFGWGKPTACRHVTVGGIGFWGCPTLDSLPAGEGAYAPVVTGEDDLAAVVFTSGSTGVPKGARYTHGLLAAQTRVLADDLGVKPGDVGLHTFPLFALFNAVLGACALIPVMDATRPARVAPEAITTPIQQHGATFMFGSPALLDRVARGSAEGTRLPSLRLVLSAGAPVPPSVLERFSRLLDPEARIVTPYGATEALPVSLIDHVEILSECADLWAIGHGTCVGRPIPSVEVAIIPVSFEPIPIWDDQLRQPPGTVGEIVVRGANVMPGYDGRPEATALARIADSAGGRAWHRMGDLGRFDERGRLWFHGRKAHRVTTESGTLDTIPTEAIFNQHPHVRRSALVGVGAPGRQRPVVCIELEPGQSVGGSDRLREELREFARTQPHTAALDTFLFHPGFPVDIRHNAKIFREKLAVWAAGRLP